jgi:hypothetical protein
MVWRNIYDPARQKPWGGRPQSRDCIHSPTMKSSSCDLRHQKGMIRRSKYYDRKSLPTIVQLDKHSNNFNAIVSSRYSAPTPYLYLIAMSSQKLQS